MEKMTFASPENIPPKVFTENGQLKGTYVDIIRAVCKRMNIEPVFVQYPWARAMIMAKNGKVDAIFPPFQTPERMEFLYFPPTPVSHTRNSIFARKVLEIKINKLKDLTRYIVGINDQYSYGPEFDSIKDKLNLDLSKTEEMQINKLAHPGQRRMDVAAASEDAFLYLAQKLKFKNEFEVVYVLSETPAYVAFSKASGEKNKNLALEFGRVFRQLKKEGAIKDINDRYFK